MRNIATLLMVAVMIAAGTAWAVDAPVDEGLAKIADSDSYAVKVPGMALYGIYEIAEAPLEPLHRPYEETVSKGDHALGWWRGINKGTYNVVEGFTRGIFNVLRAPVAGLGRYKDPQTQTGVLPELPERTKTA